jgi:D-arabinose 5-phosphate isomerase GutQ
MAYNSGNLTRLSGGSGVNLWHYTTTDTIATVNTAGYFNSAIGMIRPLDVIIAVTSTGGTPVVTLVYAKDVSSSAIDVTDGLTVTATDSN